MPTKDVKVPVRPCPAGVMTAYRVGRAVGNVRNDGPELLDPASEPPTPSPKKKAKPQPIAADLFAGFAD